MFVRGLLGGGASGTYHDQILPLCGSSHTPHARVRRSVRERSTSAATSLKRNQASAGSTQATTPTYNASHSPGTARILEPESRRVQRRYVVGGLLSGILWILTSRGIHSSVLGFVRLFYPLGGRRHSGGFSLSPIIFTPEAETIEDRPISPGSGYCHWQDLHRVVSCSRCSGLFGPSGIISRSVVRLRGRPTTQQGAPSHRAPFGAASLRLQRPRVRRAQL